MPSELHPAAQKEVADLPASLTALLRDIVDYAGLFPPARLPLEEAFDNYVRYRTEPEAWMLARFIIPAGKLDNLSLFRQVIQSIDPISLSVLGSGGDDHSTFVRSLRDDLELIARCHDQFDRRVRAEVMEVRIPESIFREPADAQPFVREVRGALTSGPLSAMGLFLEVSFRNGFRRVLPSLIEAVASQRELEAEGEAFPIGVKIRTGGLEASSIPQPEDVAHVIAACRDAGVHFKATAGLHHPMRHYDGGLKTDVHGFLNLFGGTAVAAAHALDEAEITALLLEDDPSRLRFDDNQLQWGTYEVDAATIAEVRRTLAISFGSCSFDEPRDDLKSLGLL